jgi:hypothetical protein
MTGACGPYNLGGSITVATTTKTNKNTQASQSKVSPRIQLINAMPSDKSMCLSKCFARAQELERVGGGFSLLARDEQSVSTRLESSPIEERGGNGR